MPESSKAARWAARAAAASATEAPSTAQEVSQSSKAARWAARAAAASATEAPPTAQEGVATPDDLALACPRIQHAVQPTAVDEAALLSALWERPKLVQGHREAATWPAPEIAAKGSALEAWLARAAAKELHVPWHGQRRDYVDEAHKLAKSGLSTAQIRRQRQHLNPPELARSYSSIQTSSEDLTLVAGLGWARSALDSKAAWRPTTPDIGQWMEMDLGQETTLLGVVTQGECATGCGGICGVCSGKCPKKRPCNGGGGGNFVTRICVKYRVRASDPWTKVPEDLDVRKGEGDARREAHFPVPVSARYVRIHPIDFEGCVAMRAGVLVPPRDHLFEASPFSLKRETEVAEDLEEPRRRQADAEKAQSTAATGAQSARTVPASKAARWAAAATRAAAAPASAPCMVEAGGPEAGAALLLGQEGGAAPCLTAAGDSQPASARLASMGDTSAGVSSARDSKADGTSGQGQGDGAARLAAAAGTPCSPHAHGNRSSESLHSSPSLIVLQERFKTRLQEQLPTLVQQLQAWQLPVPLPGTVPPQPAACAATCVWRVTAEVPFVVCCQAGEGDYPMILQMQHNEDGCEIMVCSKAGGRYRDTAKTAHFSGKAPTAEVRISVDARGYHVVVAPLNQASLFYEHQGDTAAARLSAVINLPLTQFVAPEAPLPIPKVDISRLGEEAAVLWRHAYQFRSDDWTLVFRQTAPFTFSADSEWAQARLHQAHDPAARNYSILDRLEALRCADGLFSLMLCYPDLDPHKRNIWRQSSNPVTMVEHGVESYVGVSIDYDEASWGGLQKTDAGLKPDASCFLDGSCEHYNWAFYAVGASRMCGDEGFAGPNFTPVRCVELYAATSDLNAPFLNEEDEETVCEHGKEKAAGDCADCRKPLCGHYIIDHSPYLPCLPGHGPRWLWDMSRRKRGRKTLSSHAFFASAATNEAHACPRAMWPVSYAPDVEQTACSGYHNVVSPEVRFSGYLAAGVPDGLCSLRWRDGHEFHGEFQDGEMSGYGRYIFADSTEFRGIFARGLPQRGMLHPPHHQPRRFADLGAWQPRTPLWQMDAARLVGEHTSMPEAPLPPFNFAKSDCLALVHVVPSQGKNAHNFEHLKRVTARLVWARPIHADQPLWNAADCRGKIVAILRGPRPPAPPCGYGIKLMHAQNAGAAACIFVDWDPQGKFTLVPRVESAPIFAGGPQLTVRIPCFLTLNTRAGTLQEGALHTLTPTPTPAGMALPPGWVIGVIVCLEQESRQTMSKQQEASLMQDFFSSRKEEREKEAVLLQESLEHLRAGVDSLGSREFVGGALFDSLNYTSENGGSYAAEEASMAAAILSRLTSKERAKELADRATDAAARLRHTLWSGASNLPANKADAAGADAAPPDVEPDHVKQLRLEKLALLDRIRALEQQNQQLRTEQGLASKVHNGGGSAAAASAAGSGLSAASGLAAALWAQATRSMAGARQGEAESNDDASDESDPAASTPHVATFLPGPEPDWV